MLSRFAHTGLRRAAIASATLLLAVAACEDIGRSPTFPSPDGLAMDHIGADRVVKLDAGTTFETDIFGPGVEPFATSCPDGSVAVGIAGTTASWVGFATLISVRLNCRVLLSDGSLGEPTQTTAHPHHEDELPEDLSMLQDFDASCAGGILVGVTGQVSTQITEIGGACATVSEVLHGQDASGTIGPWREVSGFQGSPAPVSASCGPGYAVTGLIGNAGVVLDGVGAICTALITTCPAGKYQSGGVCQDAPIGRYVPEDGMNESLPCPIGSYQDQPGQISCNPAPKGFFVDTEGASAPTICPDGTTTETVGSTSVKDCLGYTPVGDDVIVIPTLEDSDNPKDEIELGFQTITKGGKTTVSEGELGSDDSPPPPDSGKYRLPADPEDPQKPVKTYYDIKTTAEFDGKVNVCIEYETSAFPKGDKVKLLHYDEDDWNDITRPGDSRGEGDSYSSPKVCGETLSLSPFIVVQEIYTFGGFLSPIDPDAINVVKAGSAVPVKFSLGGDQGMAILAAGYPKAVAIDCSTSATQNEMDETVTAGNSTLSYNPVTDQYTYVWKTDRAWANSCRQLVVRFDDGSEYRASFHLKK